ncbi:flagellar hook-length control protein FliK [Campylobacter aviculae]|uniref:Flagellar hook-length control protein FliK n=1 Tax=Campylobacter aviculae TaxID=2510190 RepID=A0A4U7BQL2_9BACT|nr:flagellar hook-length control protein FliK [Campylobacter aviculae]TKX30427.1 flagellar hook-length control protein FliK [Campylobacter aviculae]
MSNVTPQSDVLSLTPSKTSSSDSFSKTTKTSHKAKESNANDKNSIQNTQEQENDRENFLNSLLDSIDETNEFLPDHMKISEKEVVNEAINKLQKGTFDDNDKISIFESASFMQILSLLDKLKADTADIKLANLSSQLSQLVKTEANFNALKGASNLNELLDIAKDLGLNVKNIKVDRLLDLKATFPNLDKADFFKGVVDNVFKEVINNKIAHVSKNLNHNLQKTNHSHSNKKDDHSLLSQTLKNLDSIINTKENKQEKIKIKNEDKDLGIEISNIKDKKIQTEDVSKDIKSKDTHLNIEQDKIKDTLQDSDEKIDFNIEEKQDKLDEKIDFKIGEKQDKSKDNLKNPNEMEIEDKQVQKNTKEQIKESNNESQNTNLDKNSNKEILKDSQNLSSNLTQKDITLKDDKINNKDVKLNLNEQKINFENLNKTQVVQNKDNTHLNTNKDETKNNFTLEQTKNHNDDTMNKVGLEDLNSLVKDLSKINQNNTRNITPKETLQYFSADLKEAVEQYKAPITKLSITLNPNNLGEVEVTLVQRGSNLHINFNSNTNAMNLFIQHQSEFKNSLVNMGFTGLEMNFSDQGKREQNQNKGKNRSGYGFKDTIEGNGENSKINLELVLAKYF